MKNYMDFETRGSSVLARISHYSRLLGSVILTTMTVYLGYVSAVALWTMRSNYNVTNFVTENFDNNKYAAFAVLFFLFLSGVVSAINSFVYLWTALTAPEVNNI